MPTDIKCVRCYPPGSGRCKACGATGKRGRASCGRCQGTGYCGGCYGAGFEPTRHESLRGRVVSLWWISWFGIIAGFISASVMQIRIAWLSGPGIPYFSILILIVTLALWLAFYVVEEKSGAKIPVDRWWQSHVWPRTLVGTILAALTLAETFLLVYFMPSIR